MQNMSFIIRSHVITPLSHYFVCIWISNSKVIDSTLNGIMIFFSVYQLLTSHTLRHFFWLYPLKFYFKRFFFSHFINERYCWMLTFVLKLVLEFGQSIVHRSAKFLNQCLGHFVLCDKGMYLSSIHSNQLKMYCF